MAMTRDMDPILVAAPLGRQVAIGGRDRGERVEMGLFCRENAVPGALATLGDKLRAKEWIKRALLLDPENISMRYNLACAMIMQLREPDAAIDLLGPYFDEVSMTQLRHCAVDPDMDPVRGDARFQSMLDAALARLGATRDSLPGEGRAQATL